MADVIVMPKMNLTMEDGLLARWYVSEGQIVNKGDAVCSVENDKETGDVDSLYGGVVAKLIGAEFVKYKVNDALCVIAQPGEDIAPVLAELETKKKEEQAAAEAEKTAAHQTARPLEKTVFVPKIRKILKDKGIRPEDISAEFGNIKITEKEIAAYEKKYASFRPGPNDRVEAMSSMMCAISRNMKQSCDATARLTNFIEVDMTDAMEQLAARKSAGEKLSVTAMMIKAAALALREHAICNTVFDEANSRIIYRKDINIGCAVDVENGLVVPVVRDADKKDLPEISKEVREYFKAAEAGKLTSADMEGGTFTVTSIGMLDATFFTPIINYPQTAILGIGMVQTLPRYMGDDYTKVHPRKIMTICVTYDHRVINGAPAARFLQSVRNALQNRGELLT